MKASAWNALMDGDSLLAESYLAKWNPTGLPEMRERDHLIAKTLQCRGNWQEAIGILESAAEKWGAHIGIHCDLLSCLYKLGDMQKWEQSLRALLQEYPHFSEKLSPVNRSRTDVFLGKMLEELGDIAAALEKYEQAGNVPGADGDAADMLVAKSQLLRLRSSFASTASLPQLYCELTTYEEKWGSQKLGFEVLHGLLHGETALFGIEHGFQRLQRILKLKNISNHEHCLAYFDFQEAALLADWPRTKLENLQSLAPRGEMQVFENWIGRAHLGFNESDAQELDSAESAMTTDSYLRLLLLFLKCADSSDFCIELRRKYILISQSLPNESGALWRQKLERIAPNSRVKIILDISSSQLLIGSKSISLKNRRTSLAILSVFCDGSRSICLGDIARQVWGAKNFNQSYYHRIRILIARLNRSLAPLLGFPNLMQLREKNVLLEPNISIEKKCSPQG